MAITYEPIATTTLGSDTATVTFSSLSANYTDLVVIINGAHDSDGRDVTWTINNDTGSNYSRTYLQGDGSSVSTGRGSNGTKLFSNGLGTTTNPGICIIQIMNYANTTTYKTVLNRNSRPGTLTENEVHLWRSTSAINRLDFTPNVGGNFKSGTTFVIYGIKAA